jgi:hypothetical protein
MTSHRIPPGAFPSPSFFQVSALGHGLVASSSIDECGLRLAAKYDLAKCVWRERQISARLSVNKNSAFLLVYPTRILTEQHVADVPVKFNDPVQHGEFPVVVDSEGMRKHCDVTHPLELNAEALMA